MLLFVFAALAADAPAYWSPEAVSAGSTWFGKAQSRDAKAFDTAQGQLERAKTAVSALDLGAALVGAPATLASFVEDEKRELSGQFLRLQKHTDLLATDYETVFGDAVQRALPTVGKGYTVAQCTPPTGIQAMMHRSSASCVGTDLAPALAKAIDADPQLQKAVNDILTVDWPAIELPSKPQALTAATGTARSVDAATIARALRAADLDAAQDAYEAAVEQLSDDLGSTDPATKAAAIAKGKVAHDAWVKSVSSIGKALWPDLKKKLSAAKLSDVGVCPNPVATGGCGVPDATAEVLRALGLD